MAQRLTTADLERPHLIAFVRCTDQIGRFGIHWPEIDEDLDLAGLLLGAKAPGATPPVGV